MNFLLSWGFMMLGLGVLISLSILAAMSYSWYETWSGMMALIASGFVALALIWIGGCYLNRKPSSKEKGE